MQPIRGRDACARVKQYAHARPVRTADAPRRDLPATASSSRRCASTPAADGLANDWHLVHLGSRAVGGAGAGDDEATAVDRRGPDQPAGPRASGATRTSRRWRRIVRFVHAPGRGRRACSSRTPGGRRSTARPWEGGGAGRARGGRLAADRVRRGAVRADVSACRSALDAAGIARRRRGVSRPRRASARGRASTSSRCTPRTATCCTSSCRR